MAPVPTGTASCMKAPRGARSAAHRQRSRVPAADQSRVLTKRMAGSISGCQSGLLLQRPQCGNASGQDRRLGIGGQLAVLLRAH